MSTALSDRAEELRTVLQPTCARIDFAATISESMLNEAKLAQLLAPFGVDLSAHQAGQLIVYLDLLMRWNQKINLTAVRSAEDCVTRHFGESLYLSQCFDLQGRLLDVGSGAGFPGLALKIACPALTVTLLEPVAKKRAFLKEVARVCLMDSVEVRGERLADFVIDAPEFRFDTVTTRAVGDLNRLIPDATKRLAPGGRLCLWLTRSQIPALIRIPSRLNWDEPIPVPLGRERVILLGQLAA